MTNLDYDFESADNEEASAPRGIERLSVLFLTVFAFLLPVFFIPKSVFPLAGGKSLLFSLTIIVVFSLWVIARLRDGEMSFPQTPILVAIGAIALVFTLSAVFSSAPALSFVGYEVEAGTALNILFSALLATLIPLLLRRREQIFNCYLAFLAGFFFLAFFHILRFIFGEGLLSFGIFTDITSNLLGKWNDLGIFFGSSALLSLITLEFLSLNRLFRILLMLALLVSLFFLSVINFWSVWIVIGFFSLVLLVYRLSFSAKAQAPLFSENSGDTTDQPVKKQSRFSFAILLTLIVSVIFILAGGSIGPRINRLFGIGLMEVRPSFSATFEVTRKILIDNPLLGAGPNRFANEWLKWKPAQINETIFWNTDFDHGFGLIPTFLGTSGLLGILSWLAFFALFLYYGFRAILVSDRERFAHYLVSSSFLVALFFWIFSVVYIPSQTILTFSFLFTGLFIASLVSVGEIKLKLLSFSGNPRTGFVSVLALILFLIGGVTVAYILTQKYVAAAYFAKGVTVWNRDGNLDGAEQALSRASRLSPHDVYFRAEAELSLVRMNTLLNQDPAKMSAEATRTEFQRLLGVALGFARGALDLDPLNYQNFLELGRIYEAVVPLKIEGAYESARASYERALVLNPQSPAIELMLARLEIAKGDSARAREQISKAIMKKRNYLEAIFLLSALEVADGNIKAAIESAEAAAFIAPNDATVLFQLGLLKFNNKDYKGAVSALERAVVLTPAYANARYYLGLSYEKLGRDNDSLRQFLEIQKTNPDNAEIDKIIKNIRDGRSALSASAERTDKLTLPVKEKDESSKTE